MVNPEDRLAAYFDTSQPRQNFSDDQIDMIARLLARCSVATEKSAGRSPRTYILLRTIGRLDLLQRLLSEGFGDGWFPVTSRGLPGFLDPQIKTSVLQTQHIILTKSLNLENGQHCNYDQEEQRPFDVQSYIGSGSFGQVRMIESRVTYKQYALKTVRRRMAFGAQSKEIMTVFNDEMKIMRRLKHRHIVRYVGSYTDRHDLGLVMSPVADRDLDAYLKEACKTPERHPTLRTFFGCLATALSYLHDQGIKHRDIKPRNVLIHKANVLLADFGISREFLDTTSGPTTATQRYCSPEVAAYEGRNESADIWSLGCVFLEMQAALQNRDLGWLKAFYETHGTNSTHYHANPQATQGLLKEWGTVVEATEALPLVWIGHMLVLKRKDRPTATEMMNRITASDSLVGFMYSCDQCCYSPSDPETVKDLDEDMIRSPEHIEDLYRQQPLAAVASPTKSMDLRRIPSTHMNLDRQTNGTDSNIGTSGVDLPPTARVYEPPIHGLVLEDKTASMEENPRLESNNTEDKEEFSAGLALDNGEVFDQVASSLLKTNAGHRAESTGKRSDSVDQSIADLQQQSDSAELEDLRDPEEETSGQQMENTKRTPQDSEALLIIRDDDPEVDTLYNFDDGFENGPFSFKIDRQTISFSGTVPRIIVYCTSHILKLEESGYKYRLEPSTGYQVLTQERFNTLRDAFKTGREPGMKHHEMSIVLYRYLECLAIPIIPSDALQKWPQPDKNKIPHHAWYGEIPISEQRLAIFDLEASRRDLLLYFLGYMANYMLLGAPMCYRTAENLARLYGPFIFGGTYKNPQVHFLLLFLIYKAKRILEFFQKADWSVEMRAKLVQNAALEKQKVKEKEKERKRLRAQRRKESIFSRFFLERMIG